MLQNYFLLISYQRREVLENYFFGFLSAPQTAAELPFGFLSMPKTAAEKFFFWFLINAAKCFRIKCLWFSINVAMFCRVTFFGFLSTPQSPSELIHFINAAKCCRFSFFLVSYQRRKVFRNTFFLVSYQRFKCIRINYLWFPINAANCCRIVFLISHQRSKVAQNYFFLIYFKRRKVLFLVSYQRRKVLQNYFILSTRLSAADLFFFGFLSTPQSVQNYFFLDPYQRPKVYQN